MMNGDHTSRSILTERVWPIVRVLILHALTWSGLLRFIAVSFLFNITADVGVGHRGRCPPSPIHLGVEAIGAQAF
jgi:hypothetical protein